MTIKGVDTTDRSLSGAILKLHGYAFVCRYVVNAPGGQDKQMTAAEIREKSAAGVRIVNNFEWASNPPDSRATGKEHAQANKAALARLGVPDWTMTYYSIDSGLQADSRTNYAKGWRDVYPADQLGVYTCGALFRQLVADGYVTKAWQSMSLSFPGNHLPGQPDIWDHRGADIIQTGGGSVSGHGCDFDTATGANYGGWLLGEDNPDMALTQDDIDNVANAVVAKLKADPSYSDLIWRVEAVANMRDKFGGGSQSGQTAPLVDALQAVPTTAVPAAPADAKAIAVQVLSAMTLVQKPQA